MYKRQKREMRSEKRDKKGVFLLSLLLSLLSFLPYSLRAETLADWVNNMNQPEVQQKVLSKIFSGVGPVSAAKPDKNNPKLYIFPTNGSWARLAIDMVWEPVGPPQYLVVSSVLYHDPAGDPINSASYLFRDTTRRPVSISGGYGSDERVEKIDLPRLKKSFLLLVNTSTKGAVRGQWSASLLQIEPSGSQRIVWQSPASARRFQLGFDTVGGDTEALVVRNVPKDGDSPQFSAYRWNGSRFELDSGVFERRLKALPDDVWRFGAGL
jgi:hypothetical protein